MLASSLKGAGQRASLRQSGTPQSPSPPTNGGCHGPAFSAFHAPSMDPQSFIIGLMAGISLLGGAILAAMIFLERPRCGRRRSSRLFARLAITLRAWLKGPRRKIIEEWLQAEEDHARRRARAPQAVDGRRTGVPPAVQVPGRKKEPPHQL